MAWIRSRRLSNIRGVVHGFSNREFGGDIEEEAGRFGLRGIFTLTQVHGRDVFVIKDPFGEVRGQKGDAIVTCLRGLGIGVFTADCLPILFVDRSASVVAVAHAGWRGTLSQITRATLLEMERNFGIHPGRVVSVIGPSIGRCCYEVGEDVSSLFMDRFKDWECYLFKKNDSKYVLDLREANRIALMECGVRDIEVLDICTRCEGDFHSFRRDGKGVGAQLSFIGLV